MGYTWMAAVALAAAAQSAGAEEAPIDLSLDTSRTLQVALDRKVTLHRAGQPVSGTVIEPVYSYDRVVVPAGTRVTGRVARLEKLPKGARVRAIVGGDFTPLHHAILEFDTLTFADGGQMSLRTKVGGGVDNVALLVARSNRKGRVARMADELAHRAGLDLAALKGPGKLERLKDGVIGRLPYHPQYLRKGTVYTAELLSPVAFGRVVPIERAPSGELAPEGSVLHARLLTALSSATSPRGASIRAVLTQPLFSSDHRLILPEGAELGGEVTFSRGARHLHRNGQLRFLFETVTPPGAEAESLKASLQAAELGRGQNIAIDDEGGTRVTNSNTRFILPALALLSLHSGGDSDAREAGEVARDGGSGIGGGSAGGFVGWSLLGAALSQTSRPVATVLGVVGFVRTAYGAVFGKGREVVFPADTPIELQLSAAATHP